MLVIVATPEIKLWLQKNLSKYLVNNFSKTIEREYKESRSNGENFVIKIYTNNTLTIEGSLRQRIYKQLLNIALNETEIGCDEVGIGDFFGPAVYVAAKLDQDTMEKLATTYVNIRDSKKFSDFEILEAYEIIKDIVKYEAQIVFDYQFSDLNSVEQKVVYHFKNINNSNEKVIIDLFTTVNAFNKYVKKFNIVTPNNLILETKADSKFLSVAVASIIARALFLQEMDKLELKYNFTFPKGSSNKNMDNIIDDFIKKNSIDELKKIAKTSFSTYQRAEDRWK
jgi:ribonuclease HIII